MALLGCWAAWAVWCCGVCSVGCGGCGSCGAGACGAGACYMCARHGCRLWRERCMPCTKPAPHHAWPPPSLLRLSPSVPASPRRLPA